MTKPRTNRIALPERTRLGKYRLDSVLGSGGFGVTYLAEDTVLQRRVAIKELLPGEIAVRLDGATVSARDSGLDEDFRWARERFIDEGRVLAACDHESVVQVFDIFEANNTGYLVTRFLDGVEMPEWLKGLGGPPQEKQLRSILDPLLDGLEVVHEQGFLHRDIKPANIFVTKAGRPILLDFGSARQAISSRSRPMTSIVTPGYAPFEQYWGDSDGGGDNGQGPWTDLYALAAVMIHAMTGSKPSEAPARLGPIGKSEVLLAGQEELLSRYSEGFLKSIDEAFRIHAEERPQSVKEWREMVPQFIPEQTETVQIEEPPSAQSSLVASESTSEASPEAEVVSRADDEEVEGSKDEREEAQTESGARSLPEASEEKLDSDISGKDAADDYQIGNKAAVILGVFLFGLVLVILLGPGNIPSGTIIGCGLVISIVLGAIAYRRMHPLD